MNLKSFALPACLIVATASSTEVAKANYFGDGFELYCKIKSDAKAANGYSREKEFYRCINSERSEYFRRKELREERERVQELQRQNAIDADINSYF